jgi:D-alanyl-D-alanine carboxypeptidase
MAQINPALSARFQKVLDSTCRRLNVRGASAAILIPNVGTWKGVYGESYPGKPISENMVFNIGSNTKTYTASTILLLEEKGLLSINDTIGKWIKNQPNIDGRITIRQLLNHTSGIYSYTDNSLIDSAILSNPAKIWNPADVLFLIKKPYFKPGASWHYSNTNYLLAGIIIEKVTGKSYYKAVRDLIFTPQNFQHTFYSPHETSSDTIAHNWTMNLGKYSTDCVTLPGYSNNAFFSMAGPAGEIMATAEENVEFWQRLISGQIISDSSLKQMFSYIYIGTGPTGKPVGYGLGIFRYIKAINKRTFYEHGGTNIGFIAENAVDSVSGISFSLLTNQDSVGNDALLNDVITPLHKQTLHYALSGIEDITYNAPDIHIYPNPAKDIINVQMNDINYGAGVKIYSITGREVMNATINTSSESISVSSLSSGLYLIKIADTKGAKIYSQKILIKK